jgi:hypothetical protein
MTASEKANPEMALIRAHMMLNVGLPPEGWSFSLLQKIQCLIEQRDNARSGLEDLAKGLFTETP